jgi:hypothetical protein
MRLLFVWGGGTENKECCAKQPHSLQKQKYNIRKEIVNKFFKKSSIVSQEVFSEGARPA